MTETFRSKLLWIRLSLAVGEIIALLLAAAGGAAIYAQMHRPAAVETALGCVNTVVVRSEAPTGPSLAQGGSMEFRDDIAPGHGAQNQQIRDVFVEPAAFPIANSGDHVRVCLLSVPQKDKEPGAAFGCDPNVDSRGRIFLVYNFATGSAAVYQNGEHGCGGA